MHALYETQLRRPVSELFELLLTRLFSALSALFARPAPVEDIAWEDGEPEDNC